MEQLSAGCWTVTVVVVGPGIGGFTDLYCCETVIVQSNEMKKRETNKKRNDIKD